MVELLRPEKKSSSRLSGRYAVVMVELKTYELCVKNFLLPTSHLQKKNPAKPTSIHTYCFGEFLHQIMTGKNRSQPADWNSIINSVKELWHLV